MKYISKKVKNCLLVLWVAVSNFAFAAGSADDVFSPINDKGNEIVVQLANAASVLSLIAIIGFGIAVLFGKISKAWGLSILAGCTIIFSASSISSYFLG